MDEEEKDLSPMTAFIAYLLVSVLVIAPIIVLLLYFSGFLKDQDPTVYTRSLRMIIGFGVGVLISLVISVVLTWRAVQAPREDLEEGEEEEEEDEEEDDEEEEGAEDEEEEEDED